MAAAFATATSCLGQVVFQETHTNAAGATLRGLAANDAVVVAVGDQGRILRSADGVTWDSVSSAIGENLRGVAYAMGKFIVVGEGGRIATSDDGRVWYPATSGVDVTLHAVTYGAGGFVAVGDNGTILTSTDGVDWSARASGVSAALRGVAWMTQSAAYVAVGERGTVLDSATGMGWTKRNVQTDDDFISISAGHVFFFVTGNAGVYSGTATLFARENGTGSTTFRAVAMQPQSGPIALAVGDAGVAAANRGDPWRLVASGASVTLHAITFARGVFIAAGERETILQGFPQSAQQAGNASTRIRNLSNRGLAGAGDDTLIAGFVIQGTGTKRLLIRAAGPSLSQFGVAGWLNEPTLTVFDSIGRIVAQNSGWSEGNTEQLGAITRLTGAFAFPRGSADSALLLRLPAGTYTVHITGPRSGVAMIELYDAEYWPEISTARLVNISSRCVVGTGDSAAITGIVVPRDRRLLVRASGPALSRFGVAGVLANPSLELIRPAMTTNLLVGGISTMPALVLAKNDDWDEQVRLESGIDRMAGSMDEIREATQRCGAFPLPEAGNDAAMLLPVYGGPVTLKVTGADSGSGVALIEVYDVEGL